jgi:hypothetical protein
MRSRVRSIASIHDAPNKRELATVVDIVVVDAVTREALHARHDQRPMVAHSSS